MERKEFIPKALMLLSIIGCYLTQEKKDFSVTDSDLKVFYRLSSYHLIGALAFKALTYEKILTKEKNPELYRNFERLYASALKKYWLFESEREKLYVFFQNSQIPYLPLKGILLAKEYPEENLREFSDNDILVPENKAKDIKQYFVKQGYQVSSYQEGAHDVYIKEPSLNFEIHRFLFSSNYQEKAASFFSHPFSMAKKVSGYEYAFRDEDFYLYFLAHSYKHYQNGGFGFRTLIDIYLFQKNHPNLNKETIHSGLEKLSLLEFEQRISSLSYSLLEGRPLTETEDFEYLLFSGTYGTKSHSIEEKLSKESKAKYYWHRLFPPLKQMKESHPKAFKSMIGIPFVYLFRFRKLFTKHKKIKEEVSFVNSIDQKNKKQES